MPIEAAIENLAIGNEDAKVASEISEKVAAESTGAEVKAAATTV